MQELSGDIENRLRARWMFYTAGRVPPRPVVIGNPRDAIPNGMAWQSDDDEFLVTLVGNTSCRERSLRVEVVDRYQMGRKSTSSPHRSGVPSIRSARGQLRNIVINTSSRPTQ